MGGLLRKVPLLGEVVANNVAGEAATQAVAGMARCPKSGTLAAPGTKFCPECGTKQG
jgi:uncharacterized OB-fold protein